MSQWVTEGRIWNDNMNTHRCSATLVIKEMQIQKVPLYVHQIAKNKKRSITPNILWKCGQTADPDTSDERAKLYSNYGMQNDSKK